MESQNQSNVSNKKDYPKFLEKMKILERFSENKLKMKLPILLLTVPSLFVFSAISQNKLVGQLRHDDLRETKFRDEEKLVHRRLAETSWSFLASKLVTIK